MKKFAIDSILLIALAVVLWMLAGACRSVRCVPNETRCSQNIAEICDRRGQWVQSMNCDAVSMYSGGTWACCEIKNEGYVCLPAAECKP